MNNLLKTCVLTERAPTSVVTMADILASFIMSEVDVQEMRKKRGADYDTTKFYQIRVKPNDKDADLNALLAKIQNVLKSKKAKSINITEVQINPNSRNSSKYSSVSFNKDGTDFDIVVAKGSNLGEKFEKEMLLKMDNLVAGIDDSEDAKAAFAALENIDKSFKLSNIKSVSARTGSTQRSGDISPEEAGKIIADIIIELKNGTKKYVSVKNKKGSTVAQFGISKAFTTDAKVNKSSEEWKSWIAPFKLDISKIEDGLEAAKNGTDVPWDDVEIVSTPVKKGSPIYKIMHKLWGSNYYYLRQASNEFIAIKIDENYIDSVILSGLKVTEIRYPMKERKQINIYLQSDSMKFKIEARNPRGKGEVRPTQIQLTIMSGTH